MLRAKIGQFLIESAVKKVLKSNENKLWKPKEVSERCGLYRARGKDMNNLNDAIVFGVINHLYEKKQIVYKKPSKKNAGDGGYKWKN